MGRLILAVFLLSSCAGLIWQKSGWPGALVEGDRRPPLVYSCDEMSLALSDSKYCVFAMEDHEGRKLRLKDVVSTIDAYLPNVPSLSGKTSNYDFPYRLYLLTVSPIVVMGVPVEKERRSGWEVMCGGYNMRSGCLDSQRINGIPYRFVESPEIQPGSFWFSPDLKTGEQAIPGDAKEFAIPLGPSFVLNLKSGGKNWQVRRDPR